MARSKTFVATPPGATIKEQLADRSMSQKEFAARMNMSEKHISKLINGDVQLTHDVAMRLEMVLGLPAQFWIKLEGIYREKLLKVQQENQMDADIEIARKIPYNEMAKNGWVAATRNPIDRVSSLRKFFEVVQLVLLDNPNLNAIACRRLGETAKSDYALMAWAQRAKVEAREASVAPINIEKLKKRIPDIRAMTTKNPAVFCEQLRALLAECGIALVFLPHIGGSFLHGATFVDGAKIVVGMTVRGKYADRFWFSLFHELGHIILGHIGQPNGTTDDDETNADEFARNTLIPKEMYEAFAITNRIDEKSIEQFAKTVSIDRGIVVGRLQKEGKLKFNQFAHLKTKYELVS